MYKYRIISILYLFLLAISRACFNWATICTRHTPTPSCRASVITPPPSARWLFILRGVGPSSTPRIVVSSHILIPVISWVWNAWIFTSTSTSTSLCPFLSIFLSTSTAWPQHSSKTYSFSALPLEYCRRSLILELSASRNAAKENVDATILPRIITFLHLFWIGFSVWCRYGI